MSLLLYLFWSLILVDDYMYERICELYAYENILFYTFEFRCFACSSFLPQPNQHITSQLTCHSCGLCFSSIIYHWVLMVFECLLLKGPVAGYRSILRTFISAFIASYEINIQVFFIWVVWWGVGVLETHSLNKWHMS